MDDLVWTDGMDEWTPVSEVEDLCPSPPPLPQEESSSTSKGSFSSSTSKGINSQSHSRTTGQPTSGRGAAETSAASTENSDPYAGFGRRSIAYAIDGLILFVFFFAIGALIITTSSGTQRSGNPRALEGGLRIVGFFLTWMYFALNESSRKQATWGKQLMGLKVTDLSGHKIGFWKATGRHFGKILSGMILLIGFIMAAFTEKKQALHDKMAGCLVVNESGENDEHVPETEKKNKAKEGNRETDGRVVDGAGELYCERSERAVDPIPDRRTYGEYTCPSCRQDVEDGRHPPVEEVH